MTTNEMKTILADKLKAEGTYFTKSHISIRKAGIGYQITIEDYEHIPFRMTFEEDSYFGKCVWIHTADGEMEDVVFTYSKRDYPIENALLQLGYYIGNHF